MKKKPLYRITFHHQDRVYLIYAHSVCESEMFGFLQIEDISFGEHTTVLVDPSEEKLKTEFSGVKRTYVPMHSVIRIDEVDKVGVAKVLDKTTSDTKISQFPRPDRTG